jgi:hypothetical protein
MRLLGTGRLLGTVPYSAYELRKHNAPCVGIPAYHDCVCELGITRTILTKKTNNSSEARCVSALKSLKPHILVRWQKKRGARAGSHVKTRRTKPPNPEGQGINWRNLTRVTIKPANCLQSLKCLLLNAQSVCNKALTVREHMLDYETDLLLLTETWLKPSKNAIVKELTPPGYSYIGECRGAKRGGGTGLLYRSEYKFTKRSLHRVLRHLKSLM